METLDTLKKLKIILNPPEENLKMKTLLMKNLFWNVWNTSKVSEKIPKEVGQSKRLCTTFLEIKLETLEPKISYHEDPKDIYCWEEVDKIHQEKTKFIILGVTVKDMNMAEIIWIFSKSWKKKKLCNVKLELSFAGKEII